MDSLKEKRLKQIASKLTGNENPDQYCLEILYRGAKFLQNDPDFFKYYTNKSSGFSDPDFLKIYKREFTFQK